MASACQVQHFNKGKQTTLFLSIRCTHNVFQTKDFWLNYSASAMLRYNTNSWSSWFIRDADCRFISKLTTWTPLPEYKWLLRDIKASSSHLFWFYRNLEETALWKIQGFDTWTGFCCTWCLNSHLNTTLWQSYIYKSSQMMLEEQPEPDGKANIANCSSRTEGLWRRWGGHLKPIGSVWMEFQNAVSIVLMKAQLVTAEGGRRW